MKVAALAAAAAVILAPAAFARTTGTTLVAADGPGGPAVAIAAHGG